jgi:hypothetical protein
MDAARESCSFASFLARTPGATEDFSVAAKLLVEKLDCPTARHPIVLRWIDRLKRIVPVPVPISDQRCAGDEAAPDSCDQSVDMGGNGIGLSRFLKVVLAPPGDPFVEKGEIAGRLDVVTERLQRPDNDIAMRLFALDGGVGLEHEPLRPVAAFLVLLGEEETQNRFRWLIMLKR